MFQAENTYIMSIDGDIDFAPKALKLLLRSMKKNPEVGATCGRIKPRGSGNVLVLYFIFVYSNVYISHIFRAFWICTGICDFIILQEFVKVEYE